jgi:hypothetical protein
MSQCTKTGARVYIVGGRFLVAADLHEVPHCNVVIIIYNTRSRDWSLGCEKEATHLLVDDHDRSYVRNDDGFIVCPKDCLIEVPK